VGNFVDHCERARERRGPELRLQPALAEETLAYRTTLHVTPDLLERKVGWLLQEKL